MRFIILNEDLASLLSPQETTALYSVRSQMLHLLREDRLENGGWGRRNNKTLRTFFVELPDDFDTVGSITLSRWVVDALAFSRLTSAERDSFLDEGLITYLDERFDRRRGASGRLGDMDVRGRRRIEVAVRHTGTSILCYMGIDLDRFRHSAERQLKYLRKEYSGCIRNAESADEEVGHPDILRSLYVSWFDLLDDKSPDREPVRQLIQEGFSFFWDWLNSPNRIQAIYNSDAQTWLRLYSLASVCDLPVLPGFNTSFAPLSSFRRNLHREIVEFCRCGSHDDHRAWGFPVMLMQTYLCQSDEEVQASELKALLFNAIDRGGDFRNGFCVYWAVLFSVADSLLWAAEKND